MKHNFTLAVGLAFAGAAFADTTNVVADLGVVRVEATALSKYRPELVTGGTFTDEPPEALPLVVDTLTEDFIREKNPTDLNDLLRQVPGIETGGTSLLVRQPGLFSVRGMGGTEPAFDGVVPMGRGAGLFLDPGVMERVEVVKGPIASLVGGAGAQQNDNGAGGAVNVHVKSARFDGDEIRFQETTSVGRRTWRQRAMIDVNETDDSGKAAFRAPVSFDFFSPAYANEGSQDGARPRQQYTAAPSLAFRPNDDVEFGVKTVFVSSDSPSYIGVPVWRGRPAAGYGWYESSARASDRSTCLGMLISPYVDWRASETWRLRFGGAFAYSHLEQHTREPYVGSGAELENFYETGEWTSGEKYMTSNFSSSRMFQRSFNLYGRAVATQEELPYGFRNRFLFQPDYGYREGSNAFGAPTSRYGATMQDSLGWGWVTLLAGLRYDYFVENANTQTATARDGAKTKTHYAEARECAFSPRGGLTIQPLEWLVFFGNLSQTKTPTLGYRDSDGSRPTDPWTATQWEGGFRLRPLEKLWFGASCFQIDQENTPVAETTGNETYYRFEGHNRSRGVELSLSGDLTENWTVLALYAYTHYEDLEKKGKAGDFERTPRHAFSVNTSYRLHGFDLIEDVVVSAGYRFRSKSYATMRGAFVDENLFFDPSHVFDVSLAVPFAKFGGPDDCFVTLGVRNVFGERYFDTSRHFYECFAGEPRTFEIGVRGRF